MTTRTTATSADAWSPDVQAFPPGDVIPDALILETSTVAGDVEGDDVAVRVAYVEDAVAGFIPEGSAIGESDPGLAEVLVYTGKVAQLVHLSREQYHQPGTAANLALSVRRAITKKANIAYLAQVAPTPPAVTPPGGLLTVDGIVTGDPVIDNLDALVDLIATLQVNGSNPTQLVLDPIGWARLSKIKTAADYNSTLLGAGTAAAVRMVLGLPVIVTPAMATASGLVIDKSAVVSAVGNLEVATSEHVFFGADGIAVRATWRFGANAIHPNRLGVFTIAAPEPDDESSSSSSSSSS